MEALGSVCTLPKVSILCFSWVHDLNPPKGVLQSGSASAAKTLWFRSCGRCVSPSFPGEGFAFHRLLISDGASKRFLCPSLHFQGMSPERCSQSAFGAALVSGVACCLGRGVVGTYVLRVDAVRGSCVLAFFRRIPSSCDDGTLR